MNHVYPVMPALVAEFANKTRIGALTLIMLTVLTASPVSGHSQQAVTGIVTDYLGYWKTRQTSINILKPVTSHNLLAFTYNNKQFSTGVNDGALSLMGENFTPGDFWALPIDNMTGTPNTNTKVGVGALFDGLLAGLGLNPPKGDIKQYLTDGVKGLDLGTCVANLPAGNMTFFVNNIKPENIGDGQPDVLVTQVADPSGSFDRYSFLDANGNVVGATKDIVFTNIPAVGNWTADFYSPLTLPFSLTAGFMQTDRAIRLWAADLSEFGITAANYSSIRKFRINLSGESDVAFVGYNRKTIAITSVLPVNLTGFTARTTGKNTELNWSTSAESNSSYFIVEKSTDNNRFTPIDSVEASGYTASLTSYASLDTRVTTGKNYYRLRAVDQDGKYEYSRTIILVTETPATIDVKMYPNPATTQLSVSVPAGGERLRVYNVSGNQVHQLTLGTNTALNLNVSGYTKGSYYLVWESGSDRITRSFIVK